MKMNRKGMTVVEVIIAFVMISMSFAIGMVGIACGANFINAGARLKNQDRKEAAVQMTSSTEQTCNIEMDGSTETVPVMEYSSGKFVQYRAKS